MVNFDEKQLARLEILAKAATQVKETEAAAKKEYEKIAAEILDILGERENAITETYLIQNKIVMGADGVNKALLEQKYPDIYAAVLKPGKESRRFSIKLK